MFEIPDDLYKLGWIEARLEAFVDAKQESRDPQPDSTTTALEPTIRICSINVYGLKTKWENTVFEDYVNSSSILFSSETKIKSDFPP